MNSRSTLVLISIIAITMAGCAVGRTLSFTNSKAQSNFRSKEKLAIAVLDQREEVISGKKKPTYCGVIHSGMQIGYNVNTSSGLPLADEFLASLAGSLQPAIPDVINTSVNQEADKLMDDFKASSAERLMLLTINKWEARVIPLFASIRYEVTYDLTLSLRNRNGNTIAEKTVKDTYASEESNLGVSVKKLNNIASEVLSKQLQLMLNDLAEKVK